MHISHVSNFVMIFTNKLEYPIYCTLKNSKYQKHQSAMYQNPSLPFGMSKGMILDLKLMT